MTHSRLSFTIKLIVLLVIVFNLVELNFAQNRGRGRMGRPFLPFRDNRLNKGQPVICTHDSLLIYQDCRMCVCPRSNRLAKCHKKSCDLRTKDDGQCPSAILRIDDGRLCSVSSTPGCKIDNDCPGNQLCCFDFCGGARCVRPMPLDAVSGTPHKGRGYA